LRSRVFFLKKEMSSAFDEARDALKKLPGVGYRSAERIALHLLAEHPEDLDRLLTSLQNAATQISRCECCGNLSDGVGVCRICADERRDRTRVCVVEHISDLMAIERAGTFDGVFHVLHGRLSPIRGVGPENLNFAALEKRLAEGTISELILALSNDIEGEATCHYLREEMGKKFPAVKITRIGFGLPSGGALNFADPATLRSALESRRIF